MRRASRVAVDDHPDGQLACAGVDECRSRLPLGLGVIEPVTGCGRDSAPVIERLFADALLPSRADGSSPDEG